jgi:putative Mg2+ transporter-C (MgtC) family protein
MTAIADDWISSLSRLLLALAVGGLIGWERQRRRKAAGLRTHMLVSLGAGIFALIPLQLTLNPDPDALSRAVQGVATGVGFLGAGEIIQASRLNSTTPQVKGLTSAASIWVTAALGLASGCGLWQLAIAGSFLTLITLEVIKRLEQFAIRSETDLDD